MRTVADLLLAETLTEERDKDSFLKTLETARIAYGCQVVEFKTNCVNNSYSCGLLFKKYVMNALGLIRGQKQTLTQIINNVMPEFRWACLSL